jgi:hypothetical protein
MDAEMMDALSEINSLTGVSGRMAAAATDRTAGVARTGVDGASVLGVDTTLRVFGAALVGGDEFETGKGVGSAGKAKSFSAFALSVAEAASTFLIWEALVAAAMLRMPGTGRFSAIFSAGFSGTFSETVSGALASGFGVSDLSRAGVGVGAGAGFSFSFSLAFSFALSLFFSACFSEDFLLLAAAAFAGAAFGGTTGVAD